MQAHFRNENAFGVLRSGNVSKLVNPFGFERVFVGHRITFRLQRCAIVYKKVDEAVVSDEDTENL